MTKVVYIPGFGSDKTSSTYSLLRKYVDDAECLTYDYKAPITSLNKMREVISNFLSNDEQVIVVASSLGGWYAANLSNLLVLDTILYNPSLDPALSLGKYGVEDSVLSQYAPIELCPNTNSRVAIISVDDDVVDPVKSNSIQKLSTEILDTVGGHRMTNHNMTMIVEQINKLSGKLNG